MALGISLKVPSYFRSKHVKKRRSSDSLLINPSENSEKYDVPRHPAATGPDEGTVQYDEQLNSAFFQKLPIEIRKMIYAFAWPGSHDHRYHEPNGRHLHFKDGHWTNTRCVMSKDDEDLDLIQKNMDLIRNTGQGNLLMWQRRLASTWGSRHWRCEERVEYGGPTRIDQTHIGSVMMVCKRMYPEALESYFECHKLIFNDISSSHRLLVYQPSPYIKNIRHLDLTFSLPFHECSPFTIDMPRNRLKQTLQSLRHITYLHSIRLSFDVWDRGPWRKLPEKAIMQQLESLKSLNGLTVELPPSLPIKTPFADLKETDVREDKRFRVVRRPPLRYWQFNPGEVEHFTWQTYKKGNHQHCWITLTKAARFISNPYLIEFNERH
ncbi:hypothetical protein F5Y15DRAFT_51762 [Xylariaceae sp. FL0016]|nr:hypothetical protein F5Y15DRAFT_51762 [Xylariaceae sp. FL0016]